MWYDSITNIGSAENQNIKINKDRRIEHYLCIIISCPGSDIEASTSGRRHIKNEQCCNGTHKDTRHIMLYFSQRKTRSIAKSIDCCRACILQIYLVVVWDFVKLPFSENQFDNHIQERSWAIICNKMKYADNYWWPGTWRSKWKIDPRMTNSN